VTKKIFALKHECFCFDPSTNDVRLFIITYMHLFSFLFKHKTRLTGRRLFSTFRFFRGNSVILLHFVFGQKHAELSKFSPVNVPL